MFEDEVSFWPDGNRHHTWARLEAQPRIDTYGLHKTAHAFGAIALDAAKFTLRFASVFNGATFFGVPAATRGSLRRQQGVLIIASNSIACRPLAGAMAMEGVWKTTRTYTSAISSLLMFEQTAFTERWIFIWNRP